MVLGGLITAEGHIVFSFFLLRDVSLLTLSKERGRFFNKGLKAAGTQKSPTAATLGLHSSSVSTFCNTRSSAKCSPDH